MKLVTGCVIVAVVGIVAVGALTKKVCLETSNVDRIIDADDNYTIVLLENGQVKSIYSRLFNINEPVCVRSELVFNW